MRIISISIANKETKKVLKQQIEVDILRQPSSISIQGNCGKQQDANSFHKQGMKLCPNLRIVLRGCSQFIDLLTVMVYPELSKKEKVFIPTAYLKRHQITLFNRENGFVLYGESTIQQYMEVLSQIKYVFNGVLNGELSRTITVSVLFLFYFVRFHMFNCCKVFIPSVVNQIFYEVSLWNKKTIIFCTIL